jgi:hypothetical protein
MKFEENGDGPDNFDPMLVPIATRRMTQFAMCEIFWGRLQ